MKTVVKIITTRPTRERWSWNFFAGQRTEAKEVA
jgi:hypothetical protein